MNTVTLQGVVQRTWTANRALNARLVHYDENGMPHYFSLVFDGELLVREKDGGGNATQRRARLSARNRDRLERGAVLVVSGRLVSRDERVGIDDLLRRTASDKLTEEDKAVLKEMAGRIGEENRSIVEVHVDTLAFM